MKKKIILIIMFMGIFITFGCGTKKEEIAKTGINKYDGYYVKGKNKFYLVATSKNTLEYCVADKDNNRMCGSLSYEDKKVESEEDGVKLKLNGNTLEIKTDNYFKGTYKKKKDYTIDEFYNTNYGLDKYYGNKYTGKYTNGEDTIYIYQAAKKHINFKFINNSETVDCEASFDKKENIVCEIFDTKYIIKVSGDKLTYDVKSDDKEKNINKIFTKDGTLTKKEIIDIFDPFYMLDE